MEGHVWFSSAVKAFLVLGSVLIWYRVTSQCSEAHRVACSWSIVRIEHYGQQLNPLSGPYFPDFNQTALKRICRLFKEYLNCSIPFLDRCDNQTLFDTQMLKSAFSPICGSFNKEYITHRNCYRRQKFMYDSCHAKRLALISKESLKVHYNRQMCNITNQYVKCMFLVTALQCSMEAANSYFNMLHQSISLALHGLNFVCQIRHPSDDIPVYTTTKASAVFTSVNKMTTVIDGMDLRYPVNSTPVLNYRSVLLLGTFLFVFVVI